MKIVRISVVAFYRKLDGQAWNPAFRWHERRAPLLIVETETGAQGIGEAWSRYTDCQSVLDDLATTVAPAAHGMVVTHPLGAAAALTLGAPTQEWVRAAALSALDMALWDAWAREQGQPLWQAMGGTRAMAPVYASGGLYRDNYRLDDLHDEIVGYRARGFAHVKMKIGGIDWAADRVRMATVRDALGADGTLWVDGVNQLASAQADAWLADLQAVDVAAIQSPVPFDDVDGMARINRRLPVIASEAEYRHAEFARLLKARAMSCTQFCLTLCGGISGGIALDRMAANVRVGSTPQCFSTLVAQAATLHFAAARSNVVSAEYHGFHDHLKALAQADLGVVRDGFASAGSAAGLGVAIPSPGRQDDGSLLTWITDVH